MTHGGEMIAFVSESTRLVNLLVFGFIRDFKSSTHIKHKRYYNRKNITDCQVVHCKANMWVKVTTHSYNKMLQIRSRPVKHLTWISQPFDGCYYTQEMGCLVGLNIYKRCFYIQIIIRKWYIKVIKTRVHGLMMLHWQAQFSLFSSILSSL